MTLTLTHCTIFDGHSETLEEDRAIVIEGGRIVDIVSSEAAPQVGDHADMGNRFVMPGLIDLHFHAYSVSFDMSRIDNMTPPLKTAHAARLLRGALHRGFTTVRDPAGGEIGFRLAIDEGLFEGPRYFHGGKALSQTGGHGDMRPSDNRDDVCGCAANSTFAEVVDGVDAVRKFCRNELRKGAQHIKIFISGGIASPTDPIWMPQYTNAEVSAAVEEAATRRKYVIAHCHTDEGARRCLATGVRSIDHCSIITQDTARAIAAADGHSYAVPTLAVLEQLVQHSAELGLFDESLEKAREVHASAYQSLEFLTRSGARVGFGTDLFEERFHPMQNREFEFRADIMSPLDLLRSATSVGAEIMQMAGKLGCIARGAYADILAINGNPLSDIRLLSQPEDNILAIMKNGVFVRNRMT